MILFIDYIYEKKCALCLRGCIDKIKSGHFKNSNEIYNNQNPYINIYAIYESIKIHIINCNLDYEFDFYLHGWINDLSLINNIVSDYKPKKYILELQKDFKKDYYHIENYKEILKERYKHLYKNKNTNIYNDINFQNYFQSIFSYAYSISKVTELIDTNVKYKYIINLRYDLYLQDKIYLQNLDNNLFYTDNIKNAFSPLFYGDFIFIFNINGLFIKNFYNFIKQNIFNNNEYKIWVNNIIDNKANYTGRFDHGIYSNQMILTYFITKNNIPFENVISKFNCKLINKK